MTLKYTGEGRFLPGIPDTDLTDEQLEALAAKRNVRPAELRKDLIASGLYAGKGKEAEA